MARGYPDFSGVSAFETRKHFRVADFPATAILPGATQIVFDISGQLVTDGGSVWGFATGSLADITIKLRIDDQETALMGIHELFLYGFGAVHNNPLTAGYYDLDTGEFLVQIVRNHYVGYEYRLSLFNGSLADLNVQGRIFYSDV
jgi:hypothetical protein